MKTALFIITAALASCAGGGTYQQAYQPPAPQECQPFRISTYQYSKLTGSFNNPTIRL